MLPLVGSSAVATVVRIKGFSSMVSCLLSALRTDVEVWKEGAETSCDRVRKLPSRQLKT